MRIVKSRSGQSVLEYMILTSLIAVGSIGVVSLFSHSINTRIAQITKEIQGENADSLEKDFKKVEEKHYRQRGMNSFYNGNH